MPKIVTARDAERNAAARMRELGFGDAAETSGGPDGGVDVRSSGAVAQVKYWYKPVGTPELQRLFGARGNNRHLKMLFFTRTGYTRGAVDYADEHEIALFTFDDEGQVRPENKHARTLAAPRRSAPTVKRADAKPTIVIAPYDAERAERKARRRPEHYFKVGCQIAELRMRELGFSSGNMMVGDRAGEYTVLFVDHALAGIRVTRGAVGHFTLMDLMKVHPRGRGGQRFYFSCDGYSPEAIDYADSYGIALFTYGRARTTSPTNLHARKLVNRTVRQGGR